MDPGAFDAFADVLNSPMFVLTVPGTAESRPAGCLVGFATQCSIEPIRFLVCVSKKNHTYRAIGAAPFVALQLLRDTDRELAALFGTETGDSIDKFTRCRWTARYEGVPVLDDCLAWFIGAVHGRHDLGDHVGYLLEPVDVGEAGAGTPLMLAEVRDLKAGHQA